VAQNSDWRSASDHANEVRIMSKKDPRVDAYIARSAAKTDATRQKRLQTSLEWLGEGKVRNWKRVTK
jgi:hypothetical protein